MCLSVATRLHSDREAVINSCGHEHQHSSVITVVCCPPTLLRLRDNIIVIVHAAACPRLSTDLKQRLPSFTKVESLDAEASTQNGTLSKFFGIISCVHRGGATESVWTSNAKVGRRLEDNKGVTDGCLSLNHLYCVSKLLTLNVVSLIA